MIWLITDVNNTRYYTSSQPYSYGNVYKQWPAKDKLLKWVHREVLEDSLLFLKCCYSSHMEGFVETRKSSGKNR
jgi:hypothetical protein